MRKTITILIVATWLLVAGAVVAQSATPGVLWTIDVATAGDETPGGFVIGSDGMLFLAGTTTGALGDEHAGDADAFLVAIQPDGQVAWTRQFGTAANDRATAVVMSEGGEIVVAGTTSGDLGAANMGESDGFVATFDATGEHLWTHQFGTPEVDLVTDVAAGPTGTIVVGLTRGLLGDGYDGPGRVFARSLATDGNVAWTIQLGTDEGEIGPIVAVGEDGAVWLAGSTGGSIAGANRGQVDAFLFRFDRSGAPVWMNQFGGPGPDVVSDLVVGAENQLLLVGQTEALLPSDAAGLSDVLVRRYDAVGELLGTLQFGTRHEDAATSVALGSNGSVVLCGLTKGALGSRHRGDYDAFVQTLGAEWETGWGDQFGFRGYDDCSAVAVDPDGGVVVMGTTYRSMATGRRGSGEADIYLRMYAP